MMVKEYKTEGLTVIWKPDLCTHAGICLRMLPKVYNVMARPWCRPENATRAELIAQINRCPSGALTYRLEES